MSYTLTLYPDADTQLRKVAPTYNYGTAVNLRAGSEGSNDARGLIYPNISTIPAGATITAAVLTLYCNSEAATPNQTVGVYRALTQWWEGVKFAAAPDALQDGSTWNLRNANGSVAWGAAGGQSGTDYAATATASTTITAPSAYYDWNVLADINAWYLGAAINYGWWLIEPSVGEVDSQKVFSSSDHGTSNQRPYLTITYELYAYNLDIDWMADGLYQNETTRMKSFRARRGRNNILSDAGFVQPEPGEFIATLDNYDGRYDPYNASSPLTGYILPNRTMKLSRNYGGINYPVFAGTLVDIRPEGFDQVTIRAMDDLYFLNKQNCDNYALQTAVNVVDAIAILMNMADLAFEGTSGWTFSTTLGITSFLGSTYIENNGDTIPYWWPNPDHSILRELHDIAAAFAATVFFAADGTFNYAIRNIPAGTRYSITQAELGKDIQLVQPWDELYNSIRIAAAPRVSGDTAEMWRLGDASATILPEATKTVWAEFAYNGERCPALEIITQDTSDYTASTAITIVKTDYTTEAKLAITNDDTTSTCALTMMRLRGVMLPAPNKTYIEDEDTASVVSYGKRSINIQSPWLQDSAVAEYYGDWLLPYASEVKRVLKARIMERPEYQFGAELMDKIAVTVAQKSISGNYLLGQIEHNWTPDQGCVSTLRLEPVPTTEYWTFSTLIGTTSKLGW